MSLLPTLDKPFNFGEVFFLLVAEQRLKDDFHPRAFEMIWGTDSYIYPGFHGPVSSYVLVPALLSGTPERVAHALALLAFAGAIVATASLARRLALDDRASAVAALLVASSPVALGLASTAMPDVFSLACSTMGAERAFAWRATRRWRDAVLSGLLLAGGVLFREHSVLLLPILGFGLLGDSPDGKTRLGSVLPAGLGLLAWLAGGWLSGSPVANPSGLVLLASSGLERAASNLLSLFSYWSSTTPLVLAAVLLRLRGPHLLAILGLATALVVPVHQVFGQPVWVSALVAAGLVTILVLGSSCRTRTQWMLFLWLLLALPVSAYDYMAAKYLVASAPAAAILVARMMETAAPRRFGLALGLLVVAGTALGAAIIRADAAMAGRARRAAQDLVGPSVAAGKTVWCIGGWSLRWYGQQAGCLPLGLRASEPQEGDLLVAPRGHPHLAQRFPRRHRLSAVETPGPSGRIMDRDVSAGFYSNLWGYLPWAWSRADPAGYGLWVLE